MPSEAELIQHIYMERNGNRVKNNFGWEIVLAIVECVLNDLLLVGEEKQPYIIIRDVDIRNVTVPRHICIPVEGIKPLIKVLEELITE